MKITLPRLVLVVVALWLLFPLLAAVLIPAWQERGQFGDLFGSVNALFSGLAFAGLVWALRLQQQQLEMQRTELSLQRDELALQRKEMIASRGELANQVTVQRAMFRATVAQITVAAIQARIQAIQMDSESVNPSGRDRFVKEIEQQAKTLLDLSAHVQQTGESAA